MLYRVAPDACTLIGAIRSQIVDPVKGADHHSNWFLRYAEMQMFTLVLYDLVKAQVRDNLDALEWSALETRLSECIVAPVRTDAKLIGEVLNRYPAIKSAIKDEHDYSIGACVWIDVPHFFVSENKSDFNSKLEAHLRGGTLVRTPKKFLKWARAQFPGVP